MVNKKLKSIKSPLPVERKGRFSSLPALSVVLLAENVSAGLILHVTQTGTFVACQTGAIGTTFCFITGDMGLLMCKPVDLRACQGAILDAIVYAVLLLVLTLVNPRMGRKGSGKKNQPTHCGKNEGETHEMSPFVRTGCPSSITGACGLLPRPATLDLTRF
jgi:hypothetical protein